MFNFDKASRCLWNTSDSSKLMVEKIWALDVPERLIHLLNSHHMLSPAQVSQKDAKCKREIWWGQSWDAGGPFSGSIEGDEVVV